VPQFRVVLTVEHTGGPIGFQLSDPDRDLGIAFDVLDPSGGFARFSEQIERLSANDEPNLDLAGQARPTANRGHIKDLLVRDTLWSRWHQGLLRRAQPLEDF